MLRLLHGELHPRARRGAGRRRAARQRATPRALPDPRLRRVALGPGRTPDLRAHRARDARRPRRGDRRARRALGVDGARAGAPRRGGAPAGGPMTAGAWRPLGFLVLMLGFGLRLDSEWQGLAIALLVCGAVAGGAGLWALGRGRRAALSSRRRAGDNARRPE